MDTNSIEAGRQEGEQTEMDRTENNQVEAKAESDVEEEVGMDGTVENEDQATESEGDFFSKQYKSYYLSKSQACNLLKKILTSPPSNVPFFFLSLF